jgi:nucleotide-binding universal stress UspA family protein
MLSITADTVMVPLASEDDAERTCDALVAYLPADAHVVTVHVIEKAGGAPDKASVSQREERAERIFAVAREHLGDAVDLESEMLYGRSVAETIFAGADEVDADVVAFSPREASRLTRFISGDNTLDIVTGAELPVIVLPAADGDGE